MDVNQPLGGINPIETEPAISYDNVLLTSVAASSTHDYTVAFLGTSTGHLKKVRTFNLLTKADGQQLFTLRKEPAA